MRVGSEVGAVITTLALVRTNDRPPATMVFNHPIPENPQVGAFSCSGLLTETSEGTWRANWPHTEASRFDDTNAWVVGRLGLVDEQEIFLIRRAEEWEYR